MKPTGIRADADRTRCFRPMSRRSSAHEVGANPKRRRLLALAVFLLFSELLDCLLLL